MLVVSDSSLSAVTSAQKLMLDPRVGPDTEAASLWNNEDYMSSMKMNLHVLLLDE